MAKTIIRKFLANFVMALPLDWMLRSLQGVAAGVAHLIYLRDWRLRAYGSPQFFKHQINLNRWVHEPARWAFAARGVYARENMFRGCSVLDLCCGDGSYSYLFFSDIAQNIDAVDNDAFALAYAKRYFSAPTIKYHEINIVDQPLPAERNYYDVVVWNAAIYYFKETEVRAILNKIVAAGKNDMVMCGMLPKASGYADHKFEFHDIESIKDFFLEYFNEVTIKAVTEISGDRLQPNISYYFRVSRPLAMQAGKTLS